MNTHHFKTIALAVSLTVSTGAIAQNMSKNDYKADQQKIAATYKAAKTKCATLSGNQNAVCIADAKGKEKVSTAELAASFSPSIKTRHQVGVAKADASYGVAMARCKALTGNPKDVCVKEAQAAKISSTADADTQKATSDAKATVSEADNTAQGKIAGARSDATASKVDAQYAVEKEKCGLYTGVTKDYCLAQAKNRYEAK